MTENIFNPKVTITEIRASEGGFWINPEQVSGETLTNVNLEVSVPVAAKSDDGSGFSAPVFITVRVTITDSGSTPVQRASFNVKLTGKVVISPEANQECYSEKWLRPFTVSNLYPQAQAYITMLSGMAQTFGVALPTIDPQDIANLS